MKNTNNIIGEYILDKTIGEGSFSKVKIAKNSSNETLAIKILSKSKLTEPDDIERVNREIGMIQNFDHPNIILIEEIFESPTDYYIVMEYCEKGDLFSYIASKKLLSEDESAFFYYQIIEGLSYIHSQCVVHRDLKPENMLIKSDDKLKIIDFGLSNYFNYELLSTPCGSPFYAAPEMLKGEKYNGFKIDIWSSGVILYVMLCGKFPFDDKTNEGLYYKIKECDVDIPDFLSQESIDLMKRILVKDPSKRIDMVGIKRHSFYLRGQRLYNERYGMVNYGQKNLIESNINFNLSDSINNINIEDKEKISNIENINNCIDIIKQSVPSIDASDKSLVNQTDSSNSSTNKYFMISHKYNSERLISKLNFPQTNQELPTFRHNSVFTDTNNLCKLQNPQIKIDREMLKYTYKKINEHLSHKNSKSDNDLQQMNLNLFCDIDSNNSKLHKKRSAINKPNIEIKNSPKKNKVTKKKSQIKTIECIIETDNRTNSTSNNNGEVQSFYKKNNNSISNCGSNNSNEVIGQKKNSTGHNYFDNFSFNNSNSNSNISGGKNNIKNTNKRQGGFNGRLIINKGNLVTGKNNSRDKKYININKYDIKNIWIGGHIGHTGQCGTGNNNSNTGTISNSNINNSNLNSKSKNSNKNFLIKKIKKICENYDKTLKIKKNLIKINTSEQKYKKLISNLHCSQGTIYTVSNIQSKKDDILKKSLSLNKCELKNQMKIQQKVSKIADKKPKRNVNVIKISINTKNNKQFNLKSPHQRQEDINSYTKRRTSNYISSKSVNTVSEQKKFCHSFFEKNRNCSPSNNSINLNTKNKFECFKNKNKNKLKNMNLNINSRYDIYEKDKTSPFHSSTLSSFRSNNLLSLFTFKSNNNQKSGPRNNRKGKIQEVSSLKSPLRIGNYSLIQSKEKSLSKGKHSFEARLKRGYRDKWERPTSNNIHYRKKISKKIIKIDRETFIKKDIEFNTDNKGNFISFRLNRNSDKRYNGLTCSYNINSSVNNKTFNIDNMSCHNTNNKNNCDGASSRLSFISNIKINKDLYGDIIETNHNKSRKKNSNRNVKAKINCNTNLISNTYTVFKKNTDRNILSDSKKIIIDNVSGSMFDILDNQKLNKQRKVKLINIKKFKSSANTGKRENNQHCKIKKDKNKSKEYDVVNNSLCKDCVKEVDKSININRKDNLNLNCGNSKNVKSMSNINNLNNKHVCKKTKFSTCNLISPVKKLSFKTEYNKEYSCKDIRMNNKIDKRIINLKPFTLKFSELSYKNPNEEGSQKSSKGFKNKKNVAVNNLTCKSNKITWVQNTEESSIKSKKDRILTISVENFNI